MRAGKDERLARDKETGVLMHTCSNVYPEMLLEICRWYSALPDPRTLTLTEIRFFFEGIRPSLHEATKPRKHGR